MERSLWHSEFQPEKWPENGQNCSSDLYLQSEDELGRRAEPLEEAVAHAAAELGRGVDAAQEQALPVHADQRARQQRGGVWKESSGRKAHHSSLDLKSILNPESWQPCKGRYPKDIILALHAKGSLCSVLLPYLSYPLRVRRHKNSLITSSEVRITSILKPRDPDYLC